jgi:hypothetical protein
MPDLNEGESVEMQGSSSRPYVLKNNGGVYSCTCPAWRNQSIGIERRSCKHLAKYRGTAAEEARIGAAFPAKPVAVTSESTAPPLLLAESWDGVADPAGWFMSEKLDGSVRTGPGNASSLARATSTTRPTGSSPDCRPCRSTANTGSAARRSSGQ